LCRLFGYSKQAYYKRLNIEESVDYKQVKSLVMDVRSQLPRSGGRKLYHMISGELEAKGIKMGRDKLFDYLRSEHLLVPNRKKYHKTTNSKHWMRKYPNSIKGIEIKRPEQVWVADITYLQVKKKHYYLHLITDAYSKRIVGFKLSDNMQAVTTLKALTKAISERVYNEKLTHHSDRGLQYCSSIYTKTLAENNIEISMTQAYDPYENAVAERVNGILKAEFGLDNIFETYELLELQVIQSIALYNQLRPHMSIGLLTPNQAHKQRKIKLKTWKQKTYTKLMI
jgi:transposase InsO family protein